MKHFYGPRLRYSLRLFHLISQHDFVSIIQKLREKNDIAYVEKTYHTINDRNKNYEKGLGILFFALTDFIEDKNSVGYVAKCDDPKSC